MSEAISNDHVDLDLDEGSERTFKLRGEVFRVNHVSVKRYGDAVAELDRIEAGGGDLKDIWAGQADFLEVSLHPDDLERFRAIREREADSLEPADIRKLYTWLWGLHTGRPTSSAEASSPGPESSEASSKGGSGSPVVGRPTSP